MIYLSDQQPFFSDVDLWFLALPNDVCTPFVDELERVQGENHAVLVDLSADHRFVCDHDNTNGWVYGLPERFRERIATSNKIANPGCYATGAQLSLLPLVERGLVPDGALPAIFGMSGYSGAGTSKARSLWDADLADSMLPYKLSDHSPPDNLLYACSSCNLDQILFPKFETQIFFPGTLHADSSHHLPTLNLKQGLHGL